MLLRPTAFFWNHRQSILVSVMLISLQCNCISRYFDSTSDFCKLNKIRWGISKIVVVAYDIIYCKCHQNQCFECGFYVIATTADVSTSTHCRYFTVAMASMSGARTFQHVAPNQYCPNRWRMTKWGQHPLTIASWHCSYTKFFETQSVLYTPTSFE